MNESKLFTVLLGATAVSATHLLFVGDGWVEATRVNVTPGGDGWRFKSGADAARWLAS